jgi:hypothetical protein
MCCFSYAKEKGPPRNLLIISELLGPTNVRARHPQADRRIILNRIISFKRSQYAEAGTI